MSGVRSVSEVFDEATMRDEAVQAVPALAVAKDTPVMIIVKSRIFLMMQISAALVWHLTSGSLLYTVVAWLFPPLWAFWQGFCGMMNYRIRYQKGQPLPYAPSHGVVVVEPPARGESPGAAATAESQASKETAPSLHPEQMEPIRLLVIGDSLAIGVGQARHSTPVLPEVIARTLSKRLGGRPVYWTCHGAPGASTGWIVRELERGVTYLQNQTIHSEDDDNIIEHTDIEDEHQELNNHVAYQCSSDTDEEVVSAQSSCCETTDESSSDAESDHSFLVQRQGRKESLSSPILSQRKNKQEDALWRERLAQHKKRFDPHVLGPYDIAIVMTGANDLKGAVFPFLLTGEASQFRMEAKKRGGSYKLELRRLLETLNSRMRSNLRHLRESVEAATEQVRERILEELAASTTSIASSVSVRGSNIISAGTSPDKSSKPASSVSLVEETQQQQTLRNRKKGRQQQNSSCPDETKPVFAESSSTPKQMPHQQQREVSVGAGHGPLVVLPGNNARTVPAFRWLPLNWLVVPIVDIMELHKRNFAQAHSGEVLFIDAPSAADMSEYMEGRGPQWEEKCQERVLLSVRDIPPKRSRRIERSMREFYKRVNCPIERDERLRHELKSDFVPSYTPPSPHHRGFSIDGVHPNDMGYDFWGRYIADAIVKEWQKQLSH